MKCSFKKRLGGWHVLNCLNLVVGRANTFKKPMMCPRYLRDFERINISPFKVETHVVINAPKHLINCKCSSLLVMTSKYVAVAFKPLDTVFTTNLN